ncbi:pentapeptide repeat-containing protein [Leptospira santarosai]|uniref:pentapeptide repeat-containing protein n=1 Tax=Leptospira santarosai TaxID=28183 RepID=UPI0006ACE829|nr:pentapeptide repeat-containing protein [Leptospira santarosai]
MRTYTNEELQAIIESHLAWLHNKVGGIRANLRDADLRRANLYNADLRGADLRRADLCGANLYDVLGNSDNIKTIQTDLWLVVYSHNAMYIGCKVYSFEEW